jgi:ubiquinone/menaquinone biosynthesis C-methylase UbiE
MEESAGSLSAQPGKSPEEIKAAYDEEEAADCANVHWLKRRLAAPARRQQFAATTGRVLDVACGTGVNFAHPPDSTDLVGIDLSAPMLTYAQQKADELGRQVDLEQMDAQRLSFATDSFDHVISSFSACTFPDPVEALNEMRRVCRPDGQVRLLEHHKWKAPLLDSLAERMHEGEYDRVGCRLYEDPTTVVRQSQLEVVSDRRWRFPPFTGIVARPPTADGTSR